MSRQARWLVGAASALCEGLDRQAVGTARLGPRAWSPWHARRIRGRLGPALSGPGIQRTASERRQGLRASRDKPASATLFEQGPACTGTRQGSAVASRQVRCTRFPSATEDWLLQYEIATPAMGSDKRPVHYAMRWSQFLGAHLPVGVDEPPVDSGHGRRAAAHSVWRWLPALRDRRTSAPYTGLCCTTAVEPHVCLSSCQTPPTRSSGTTQSSISC